MTYPSSTSKISVNCWWDIGKVSMKWEVLCKFVGMHIFSGGDDDQSLFHVELLQ